VIVVDTFGVHVSSANITLSSVGPTGKFASDGNATFDRIPFGIYDVEARLAGFLPRTERIRVYQPSVVINLGLEPGTTHSYERPELSGVLSGPTRQLNLWVRLVAVYSSDLVENVVDGSGHFELDGMPPGKYLLLLFQKERVLAMKPLDILEGKQTIDLVL
jgi:hypothetical protein